ncbi:hypothetical protein KAI12_00245 [Candidatus Bathyarchaeota archaeon]|nr:hypothetical protein [Candidatus Bathyarchaeota archaeon]
MNESTAVRDEKLVVDKYKIVFDLWKSENSIKTSKLQVLLATNAILVSAFFLTEQSIWIALVGFIFSFVWILSIGRTIGYQQHWKSMLEDIRKKDPNNQLFQIHSAKAKVPIWGRVPSKYYLLGTPIATTIAWLIAFIINAV